MLHKNATRNKLIHILFILIALLFLMVSCIKIRVRNIFRTVTSCVQVNKVITFVTVSMHQLTHIREIIPKKY